MAKLPVDDDLSKAKSREGRERDVLCLCPVSRIKRHVGLIKAGWPSFPFPFTATLRA